jgi:hypothetical protein
MWVLWGLLVLEEGLATLLAHTVLVWGGKPGLPFRFIWGKAQWWSFMFYLGWSLTVFHFARCIYIYANQALLSFRFCKPLHKKTSRNSPTNSALLKSEMVIILHSASDIYFTFGTKSCCPYMWSMICNSAKLCNVHLSIERVRIIRQFEKKVCHMELVFNNNFFSFRLSFLNRFCTIVSFF